MLLSSSFVILHSLLSRFFFSSYITDLKELIQSAAGNANKTSGEADDQTVQLLKQINDNLMKLNGSKTDEGPSGQQSGQPGVGLEQVVVDVPSSGKADSKEKAEKKTVQVCVCVCGV